MVGLHIRGSGSLTGIIQKAIRLELNLFQCFLTQKNGSGIPLNPDDCATFVALRQQFFPAVFLHASYWINLCQSDGPGAQRLFAQELSWAKRLSFTHMILHPGSAKVHGCRATGIDFLVRTLNRMLKYEQDITLVLENSAHGNMSVGGDLCDFAQILAKIDYPEKIKFCIDTAHAYSFGYDLIDPATQDTFIDLIEQTIGIDKVALIHLNDTHEQLGSYKDRHALLGQGTLGEIALKRFMCHPKLQLIPVLLELPEIAPQEEQHIINKVITWHKEKMI